MKNNIVLAKMDVAISLSSISTEHGFYCLCDFTVIKKIGNEMKEMECDALPDRLEFLPGDYNYDSCYIHCD